MYIIRTANVWENVNIIGDVLIRALHHHPTFTFPIFNHNFLHTTSVKTKRDNVGLF